MIDRPVGYSLTYRINGLNDALRVSVCSSQSLFGSLLHFMAWLYLRALFNEIFFRMGVAFFHVGISPAVM